MGTRKTSSQVMRFPTGRRVPRRKYVPPGRALHLIDIENLVGGPEAGAPVLRQTRSDYRDVVPSADHDHYVIGANPRFGASAMAYWPSARLVARPGSDGADIALIKWVRDVEFIVARYDRLVIGSGDGDFLDVVMVFEQSGLAVEVASRRRSLSRKLQAAASVVWILPELDLDLAA